jgi:proteasome accessory factor B
MTEQPRYSPAERLLRVRRLLEQPDGASIYDIGDELGVSPRTALRYLQALERSGEALHEEMVGTRKHWRVMPSARRQTISLTVGQAATLFISSRMFEPFAGTGIKEDFDEVFARLHASLRKAHVVGAANLDRKFFDVNEAPHIYSNRIEDMNDIMTALLREERLRVCHGSVDEYKTEFVLEPYTLLVYKKGLYLAGLSHHHAAVRTFSLDGFRSVQWLRGERFTYPTKYHPSQLAQGAFGLIGGKPTRVRIFFDDKVARFVRRRTWHPTQKITKAEGGIVLTMQVAGTTELESWVLGFGEFAEVLEPAELRGKVAASLRKAAALYRGAWVS